VCCVRIYKEVNAHACTWAGRVCVSAQLYMSAYGYIFLKKNYTCNTFIELPKLKGTNYL
jgi:hypothetical protein